MSLMRIRFLGGLALFWDNQPLPPIPGAAARSIFAYLVTCRDRAHTRDLLAGTFWPDLPDAVARRRLSQALWQIRSALSPHPILLTEGNTVQVNPELALGIDVEHFIKHKAECEKGGPEALEHCELCVEHYRGDFLAGYYDDWVIVEQERLRKAFLGILERLVGGLKAQGDYERALAFARRLVTEDPLHEETHREVMRLCHLLGRDNEALKQFEICREVLAEELLSEPSPETAALAAEIAAQTELLETPHLPVASQPSPLALLERPDQVPLVGRQAERAELLRYLELAMSGSGGLVLLVGSAGVGKTRLMQELARDGAWRGARVAWGRSCEMCAPPPYQPLVEVLSDADLSQLAPVWQGELARLIPALGQQMPTPGLVPPLLEPEPERGRLLEALARAFLALGQTTPHLVILEDLQWIDSASLEALRVLLPRLPTSRLLLVCTLRPEELAGQPAVSQSLMALEDTRIPRRLELIPLTAAETQALIERVLETSQSAPLFSQRLYDGTEGNPFFITETLRALVDEGLLYRDQGGGWRTPWDEATKDYAELPLAQSIAHSIEQRLARLSPSLRDLLGVAAVVGRQVEFDLWLAATEFDEAMVLSAAEELTRRGLLVEMTDLLGYRFAHDTIRQVVYECLSAVRRRQWHRRVAAGLETLHPEQVEALARHSRLGQQWPQAVRYALLAGERAQTLYASQQALDHYRRADVWLSQGWVDWPPAEIARWRANLAERQGQIHSLVGEFEAADAAFDSARRTWADLNDRPSTVRVLNQISFLYLVQDDYARASQHAEQALAALHENDPPPDLRAITLTHVGLSAWGQQRYDEALVSLKKALALFEEIGTDLDGLARCLNSLGMVHLARGDLDLADRYFADSLTLRQQIGDRRGEAWCWVSQGRSALARGNPDTAREKLETAHAIFVDIQHPSGLHTCAQLLNEAQQAEAATHQTRRVTVRLPRTEAPTGRPLRDAEYAFVNWTVASPEDERIAAKVARRQHRLLRLLQEAADQSAAPTVDDLAAALGVSQPTIKRDLEALRRAGHEVHTRGSRGG